jgi:hypothetical protein
LIRRDLREEAGYSLVEVLFSIILLTIAILPMVGMFDMGIKSATADGSYEEARALASLKMEEAKGLPFGTLRDNFPVAPATTTYDGSGHYQSPAWIDTETQAGPASAAFAKFDYMIDKQYMAEPVPANPSPGFAPNPTATDLIRVKVTVRWPADDGNTYQYYTTYGLVTS